MKKAEVGLLMSKSRQVAGLTQAQVASLMETTQSAIARAEAGAVLPSLEFLQRFVNATGKSMTLELKPRTREPSRREIRNRARNATGKFVFNPWDREPSEAEAKSLLADGLTRERFAGSAPP